MFVPLIPDSPAYNTYLERKLIKARIVLYWSSTVFNHYNLIKGSKAYHYITVDDQNFPNRAYDKTSLNVVLTFPPPKFLIHFEVSTTVRELVKNR